MEAVTEVNCSVHTSRSIHILPKKRHKNICRLKRLRKKAFSYKSSTTLFKNTTVHPRNKLVSFVSHKENLPLVNQFRYSAVPRQTLDKMMIPISNNADPNNNDKNNNNNIPKLSLDTETLLITKYNTQRPAAKNRNVSESKKTTISPPVLKNKNVSYHKKTIISNDTTDKTLKKTGNSDSTTRKEPAQTASDSKVTSRGKFRTRFPFSPSVLVVALLSLLSVAVECCRYSTVDSRHTMCVFMPKQCPGKMLIRTGELTCHDKERILTKHNMLRQEAALGQVRGQPAALNMRTMVWDDELAMVAQRWADQCMPGHDRSRNVGRFAAGQNVAAVWTYERDEGDTPDFTTQVEAWFMEVDQHGFSKGSVDPFRFSKPTGHYTQLVWADTYLVGCGYTYYLDSGGNGYTKLYVCNYGPGGNVVGGSMYKVGFPGQPYCVGNGLRPSTDYQGLCEEDGVNYKSMCAMGGSSMFHKPKASSLMMMMDGNHVEEFQHSHARTSSSAHPMEVMHPDPPHMEMHDMMHSMRAGPSHALHHQQGHMMLPPPPPPPGFGPPHRPRHGGGGNNILKNIRTPFVGLVNALNPWDLLDRFKLN